jgi:hypothetical protein
MEVQWTKVRMLMREFELRPWFCQHYAAFCDQTGVDTFAPSWQLQKLGIFHT